MNRARFGTMISLLALSLNVWTAHALSPEDLADRVEAAHAEQLRNVEQVSVKSEISTGMLQGMTSTGRYVKEIVDGRAVLREVEEDDAGTMNLAGMHDGTLPKMVRHARSIERGRLDGERVYIVTVDDVEFLKSLDELSFDQDMMDDEFEPKSVTLWLAAADYTARKLEYVQSGPGGGNMTVTVTLGDYRVLRGLPIAHKISIAVSGMDQMMSAEDLAEARQQMQMMQEQLAMLPPEQRAMIEASLAPQLAQMEEMMSSGGTQFDVQILDVSFD